MGFAVELLLDEPGAKKIRDLFERTRSCLAVNGASPHISLAVFNDVDTKALIGFCRRFFSSVAPFDVQFSSLGMFMGEKNVIFLAPVVTFGLLKIHRQFHEGLNEGGLKSSPLYSPGRWVPHCTISEEQDLSQAMETIRSIHHHRPTARFPVSSAHVVEFRPVVTLASIALAGIQADPCEVSDGIS